MESINQMKKQAEEIQRKSKKLLAFTIITLAASALAANAQAQTFAEWFRQKSTQKKYLLQQIAALQAYRMLYRQGNGIAHNGLGLVSGSLTAENGLHQTYYNSLQKVSPALKNNKQVSDILQWQKDILIRMGDLEKTGNINGVEKQYIIRVKTALLNDCHEEIAELENVLKDGKLKMNDEGRLKHVGVIHTDMQNNYRFASAFSGQVKILALQRLKENNNVITEKKIYGIQ